MRRIGRVISATPPENPTIARLPSLCGEPVRLAHVDFSGFPQSPDDIARHKAGEEGLCSRQRRLGKDAGRRLQIRANRWPNGSQDWRAGKVQEGAQHPSDGRVLCQNPYARPPLHRGGRSAMLAAWRFSLSDTPPWAAPHTPPEPPGHMSATSPEPGPAVL